MRILALDPGTIAGATWTNGELYHTELWKVAAQTKTKKRPGEPKYYRLLHLWESLEGADTEWGVNLIVCEGAQGFQRGKAAVEASHKYRAVVELFGAINEIEVVMIAPNDLKEFALGKRSGSKDEMVLAANRLGYVGSDDNEADSFLIAKWAVKFRGEK